MAEWREKSQCIQTWVKELWTEDASRKYAKAIVVPPAFADVATVYKNMTYSDMWLQERGERLGTKIYELIDQIISDTIKKNNDDFLDKFVDIKEVPYGTYNSDANHRGS